MQRVDMTFARIDSMHLECRCGERTACLLLIAVFPRRWITVRGLSAEISLRLPTTTIDSVEIESVFLCSVTLAQSCGRQRSAQLVHLSPIQRSAKIHLMDRSMVHGSRIPQAKFKSLMLRLEPQSGRRLSLFKMALRKLGTQISGPLQMQLVA